jgi:hypothetical protein
LELSFVPSPQPHLAVHASYELQNSGTQPLQSLSVMLPPAGAFHRTATAARWNNQALEFDAPAAASPIARGDSLELRLPEAWAVKQQRSLVLDYDLATGSHLGSFLSTSSESFFAYPDSWNPALLAPKHLFGTGGVPPKKWTVAVRVPAGYLVHASGAAGKQKRSTGDSMYSFTQQPHGYAPFVAGGKYVEQEVRVDGQRILIWIFRPASTAALQKTVAAVAARARYYESEYGSLTGEDRTVRLIECVPPSEPFGCGALPQTVLVHQNWVARGLSDEEFYEDANFELAYTWFGGAARVRFDETPLPMDALAPYAGWEAQAFAEGGSARDARISALIADFDKHTAGCKEKFVLPLPAGSAGCSYSAAWTKSGLFFFAFEDKVGRAPFHAALKQMLDSRRGRDVSLEDLIAAVDSETQQPQGQFVRAWLKHSGIPDEFRARYAGMATAQTAGSEANFTKEH